MSNNNASSPSSRTPRTGAAAGAPGLRAGCGSALRPSLRRSVLFAALLSLGACLCANLSPVEALRLQTQGAVDSRVLIATRDAERARAPALRVASAAAQNTESSFAQDEEGLSAKGKAVFILILVTVSVIAVGFIAVVVYFLMQMKAKAKLRAALNAENIPGLFSEDEVSGDDTQRETRKSRVGVDTRSENGGNGDRERDDDDATEAGEDKRLVRKLADIKEESEDSASLPSLRVPVGNNDDPGLPTTSNEPPVVPDGAY
ncbi:hypothetical protein BESB_080460 [Besnoitia besnoiti]|uniref:Transmembrane protein n=1 Tax=Besnoitia besnoiti TaxID=94643 RepID=A0A2A9MEM5_BESBE|nr:hypothetical protein BESB_080460 [Besnoitia besnoiti]PFH33830.1 hypothetical protein BESB_080460 [Besnoitia besnoiti]